MKTFTPLEIRVGYRNDGMLFAVCSECGEHVAFAKSLTINKRVWEHTVYLVDKDPSKGMTFSEYCPN